LFSFYILDFNCSDSYLFLAKNLDFCIESFKFFVDAVEGFATVYVYYNRFLRLIQ
jgi:hypothetical protein